MAILRPTLFGRLPMVKSGFINPDEHQLYPQSRRSLLRLVTGVLIETSETRETGSRDIKRSQ